MVGVAVKPDGLQRDKFTVQTSKYKLLGHLRWPENSRDVSLSVNFDLVCKSQKFPHLALDFLSEK